MMKGFRMPVCPYCGKKVDLITTWMLRRQGEYRCPRLPWRIDDLSRYESFIFRRCRRDYRSFDFLDYPGHYAKNNAVDHFLDFNSFHPFLYFKLIFCSFKAAGRP